jgi:hypothetical protein
MTESYAFQGVDIDIKRTPSGYIITAGGRRAVCARAFDTAEKAKNFVNYAIDIAKRTQRFPLVDGFPGRLLLITATSENSSERVQFGTERRAQPDSPWNSYRRTTLSSVIRY